MWTSSKELLIPETSFCLADNGCDLAFFKIPVHVQSSAALQCFQGCVLNSHGTRDTGVRLDKANLLPISLHANHYDEYLSGLGL